MCLYKSQSRLGAKEEYIGAHLNTQMNNLCTFSDETQMWDEILINSPDQSCCVNLKCFQYFDKTLKKN